MDFDEVADALYRLQPGEFTAARDAGAAEARTAGDRALGEAVKQLRKPTVSAWLANLLVGERPDEIDQLLALGEELRDAQENLAGDELRRLAPQRHQVVTALIGEARRLAGELGEKVSDSTMTELEGTLEAALSDEVMAETLRQGRLTTALQYAGLGFGVSGVAPTARERSTGAGGGVGRTSEVRSGRKGDKSGGRVRAGDGERASRTRDLAALSAAEREVDEAAEAATAAGRAADDAEREVDRLSEQALATEAALVSLRAELRDATRRATTVRKERDAAAVALRRAEHALAALRKKG